MLLGHTFSTHFSLPQLDGILIVSPKSVNRVVGASSTFGYAEVVQDLNELI